MNSKHFAAWQKNNTINPHTGRSITKNGPTWKKLVAEAEAYSKKKNPVSTKKISYDQPSEGKYVVSYMHVPEFSMTNIMLRAYSFKTLLEAQEYMRRQLFQSIDDAMKMDGSTPARFLKKEDVLNPTSRVNWNGETRKGQMDIYATKTTAGFDHHTDETAFYNEWRIT